MPSLLKRPAFTWPAAFKCEAPPVCTPMTELPPPTLPGLTGVVVPPGVTTAPPPVDGVLDLGPDDADIEPTLESIKWFRPNGEPDDPDVRIAGEDHGTGLGSWVGGVAPTEQLVRNPRTGEGGQG